MKKLIFSISLCLLIISYAHSQSHTEIIAPTSEVLTLDSEGTPSTVLNFRNEYANAAGGDKKRAYISTNNNIFNFGLSNNNAGGSMQWITDATTRMTLLGDGRFGIGIIPPLIGNNFQTLFQVESENFQTGSFVKNSDSTSDGPAVKIDNYSLGSNFNSGLIANVYGDAFNNKYNIAISGWANGNGPNLIGVQGQAPDEGLAAKFIGRAQVTKSINIGEHPNTPAIAPMAGDIQWNSVSGDFEGFTGTLWESLTSTTNTNGGGQVTDIDGNCYLTVTIGTQPNTQTWMRQNLRTTRYRNGDPIPEVLLGNSWGALTTGGWNWYDNDPKHDLLYGKLYNWHAVNDTRGICPSGWHVASETEYLTLINYLGGQSVAGAKMKTTGTLVEGTGYWADPNTGATNESGFTGLPSGGRAGGWVEIGLTAVWWTSTAVNTNKAKYLTLGHNTTNTNIQSLFSKNSGFCVRCLKD